MKPSHGSRGYVDGDEEHGFRFLLLEERREKEEKEGTNIEEQQDYKRIKKFIFHTSVSFFLNQTHTYQIHFYVF